MGVEVGARRGDGVQGDRAVRANRDCSIQHRACADLLSSFMTSLAIFAFAQKAISIDNDW